MKKRGNSFWLLVLFGTVAVLWLALRLVLRLTSTVNGRTDALLDAVTYAFVAVAFFIGAMRARRSAEPDRVQVRFSFVAAAAFLIIAVFSLAEGLTSA